MLLEWYWVVYVPHHIIYKYRKFLFQSGCSFSLFYGMDKTSGKIMKINGEPWHLNVRAKPFSLSPLSMMLAVTFTYVPLYQVQRVLFYS